MSLKVRIKSNNKIKIAGDLISNSSTLSQLRAAEKQEQKQVSKMKMKMDWRLGLDMKYKRSKLKVYYTATKEYQDLIKHQKEQLRDEFERGGVSKYIS